MCAKLICPVKLTLIANYCRCIMHITVVKIELTSWINDFLSILPGQAYDGLTKEVWPTNLVREGFNNKK